MYFEASVYVSTVHYPLKQPSKLSPNAQRELKRDARQGQGMTNQGDAGLYASIASCCTLAREDVLRGLVSRGNPREGILFCINVQSREILLAQYRNR
jgi:hypothetical protein